MQYLGPSCGSLLLLGRSAAGAWSHLLHFRAHSACHSRSSRLTCCHFCNSIHDDAHFHGRSEWCGWRVRWFSRPVQTRLGPGKEREVATYTYNAPLPSLPPKPCIYIVPKSKSGGHRRECIGQTSTWRDMPGKRVRPSPGPPRGGTRR